MIKCKGFTLIELLITITIIGILATVIMINYRGVQKNARDTKRKEALDEMRSAIVLYHNDYKKYPAKPTGCPYSAMSATERYWASNTPNFSSSSDADCVNNSFIVGLGEYLPVLPKDPGPSLITSTSEGLNTRAYLYQSDVNGTDYKLVVHSPENCVIGEKKFWDPRRDGGSDNSIVDSQTCWAWATYSSGAKSW